MILGPRRRALTVLALLPACAAHAQTSGAPLAPIVQPARRERADFAARALANRDEAVRRGDQAYGAIVVKAGVIVGDGVSAVVTDRDPTAHAEMVAIRDAARRLGTNDLSGCELYGSSRACPMCEAAAYWARIERMYFGPGPTEAGAPRLR